MGRVILVGASTLMTALLVMLACSSSTSTGSGTSAADGSNGTGGATGSGGSGGGVSPGKATIEFTVTGGSYCMTSQCGAGAGVGLKDSSGKSLALTTSCSDVSCKTCVSSACPGYFCQPNGIVVTGAGLTWDGTNYITSTCGTGTSCTEPSFAKPGKYTATMCATPGKLSGPDAGPRQCVTNGPEKCGSVEFDFPSSTVVKGTVGP
jgi:hypothetical protein